MSKFISVPRFNYKL